MKAFLTFIKGEMTQKFPKHTDAIWLSKKMYQSLVAEHHKGPAYVKVSSNEPLKEFTLFCKVEMLAKEYSNESGYILPALFPKSDFIGDLTPIDLEYLNLDVLKEAQSVVLKLPEDMVMTWAEDESEFAKRHYITTNKLAYSGQTILLQSGIQKSVLATIKKVFPNTAKNEAVTITRNTSIVLEGLPENQQKTVNFERIGGLDYLVERIREIIQIPLTYPGILDKFRIQAPKGLLLFGPPGNGKTMIAKAIADSLGAKFVSIEGPELNSKYVGVAEQRLREKFEEASQHKNSVLFIDEIDSIARNREHENSESHQIDMVSTLLNLMDGIRSAKGLFVIGATNRLNAVDSALRRPGRFELEYEIGLPDQSARLEILKKYIPEQESSLVDTSINDDFVKYLSEVTNGYSGADIVSLYRLSVIKAIRRNLSVEHNTGKINLEQNGQVICLESNDFQQTLREITPTSLRGIDTRRQAVDWDELIIAEDIRSKIEAIDHLMEKATKSSFSSRPPFMNVMLKGQPRSGKKTIIQSFAKRYKYEMIEVNLMDYLSDTFSKTISDVENKIQRCKQVAPCVFFIENSECFAQTGLLLAKVFDMLEYIGNRQPVLLVVSVTESADLEDKTGFGQVIDIPAITEKELSLLAEKYEIDPSDLITWKDLPTGRIINKIEEFLIMQS